MSDTWFYEANEQSVGPVNLEELVSYLSKLDEWRRTLVWQEGLAGWKQVCDIPELSRRLIKPPPLPNSGAQTSVPRSGTAPRPKLLEPEIAMKTERAKKPSRILQALAWIGLFFAAVFGTTMGGPIGREIGKAIFPDRAIQIAQKLSETEALIRPSLPKKVDEFTTIASVDHEGSRLRIHGVVDPGKMVIPSNFIDGVRASNLPKVCADHVANGIDAGVTFEYIYKDVQSKNLGSFSITAADCKGVSH